MINLTKEEYNKRIKNSIISNENYLFTNPKNKKEIIKINNIDIINLKYNENKQYTIKLLVDNYEYLQELDRIIIPKEIVSIDLIPSGYTMKYLKKSRVLKDVLNDQKITIDSKISYLKQIGEILRQLDSFRDKYPNLSNLYYNDIHEGNFLITKKEEVYGIDFESCSILDNIPTISLYPMLLDRILLGTSYKYPSNKYICESSTNLIPNRNLDLYSYTMIILNFMYGINYHKWTKTDLNIYLNYLDYHGANKEFLYTISYLYDENKDNINPDYLLDYIKEMQPYCIKLSMDEHYKRLLR